MLSNTLETNQNTLDTTQKKSIQNAIANAQQYHAVFSVMYAYNKLLKFYSLIVFRNIGILLEFFVKKKCTDLQYVGV